MSQSDIDRLAALAEFVPCGAVHPNSEDKDPATCTYEQGHGKITEPAEEIRDMDHGDPVRGVWWNSVGKPLPRKAAPDVSEKKIPEPDRDQTSMGKLLAEAKARAEQEYPITDDLSPTERSVRLILQEGFGKGYMADREEAAYDRRDMAKAFREGAYNMSDRWRESEPPWPLNPYTETGGFTDD